MPVQTCNRRLAGSSCRITIRLCASSLSACVTVSCSWQARVPRSGWCCWRSMATRRRRRASPHTSPPCRKAAATSIPTISSRTNALICRSSPIFVRAASGEAPTSASDPTPTSATSRRCVRRSRSSSTSAATICCCTCCSRRCSICRRAAWNISRTCSGARCRLRSRAGAALPSIVSSPTSTALHSAPTR